MQNYYVNVNKILFALLFFMIILFNYQLTILKIGILLLLLLINLSNSSKVHFYYLRRRYFFWFLLYVIADFFFMTYGLLRGNQVQYYINTELVYPIVFCILAFFIHQEELKTIFRCIYFFSFIDILVALLGFIYFNTTGASSFFHYEGAIRPDFPFIAIAAGNITGNIYVYLLVFTFSMLTLREFRIKNNVKVYLILGFVYFICTSRRAVYIVMLMSLFMVYFFSKLADNSYKKKIIKIFQPVFRLLFIFIIVLVVTNSMFKLIDFRKLLDFFMSSFRFASSLSEVKGIDISNLQRYLQFFSLINGWLENPLFGAGIAANASVVRSDVPGMYELTYVALLFQRGLVGLFIYLWIYFYIFKMYGIIMKKCKKDLVITFCISLMVGYISLLVMNATNPYLTSFDNIWIIFINLYVLNVLDKCFIVSDNGKFDLFTFVLRCQKTIRN